MNVGTAIVITIFFLPLIILVINLVKGKKDKQDLEQRLDQASHTMEAAHEKISMLRNERDKLLERYSPIFDVENHAAKLLDEAEDDFASKRAQSSEILANAEFEANGIREKAKLLHSEASQRIKDSKQKAEVIKMEAREEAEKVIDFSEKQAKEIAGDAYEAKAKADSYNQAIRAMRNTIDGYKDDYIIPNHSIVDDLAEEFGHKEAGDKLKAARKRVREMVKDGHAGACDYVEHHRKTYAIHFAVDAFNGKVDSALSKIKHDNYGKIKQEMIDAFALVNHNGSPFRNARITQEYLDARLNELKWAVATLELKKIEREEQAEIKAQIREEERAIREMEKARKEAEKEERVLQKALEKARSELAVANDEQRFQYETQLAELEEKLKEAEEKGHRALSMAQQTRRGHVYIISNIGSFGEEIFKIGMTRRLEPMDRVKELGDASVPFSFDVHAMIYSEDAPALEKELHRNFHLNTVNKINPRKEFFKTTVAEIKQAVEHQGVSDVHWTLKAEASEYRESIAIAKENLTESVA